MASTGPGASPTQRRLLVLGAALFLLGLLTGFVPGSLANPRRVNAIEEMVRWLGELYV